jgi:hypothetical protein
MGAMIVRCVCHAVLSNILFWKMLCQKVAVCAHCTQNDEHSMAFMKQHFANKKQKKKNKNKRIYHLYLYYEKFIQL